MPRWSLRGSRRKLCIGWVPSLLRTSSCINDSKLRQFAGLWAGGFGSFSGFSALLTAGEISPLGVRGAVLLVQTQTRLKTSGLAEPTTKIPRKPSRKKSFIQQAP